MTYEEFKKLQPDEKLDFILSNMNHDKNMEMIFEIEESLGWETNKLHIDKELNVIIDKLLNDEYILQKHLDEKLSPPWSKYSPAGWAYYISFAGKVLIEKGGYQQKAKDDKLKKLKKDIKYYIPIGIAVSSLIVSVLSVFYTWYSSGQQIKESRIANGMTRKMDSVTIQRQDSSFYIENRPFLSIDNIKPFEFKKGDSSFIFSYQIENTGHTPAYFTRKTWCIITEDRETFAFKVESEHILHKLDSAVNNLPENFIVGGNQHIPVGDVIVFDNTGLPNKNINEMIYWFIGEIIYRDIFNKQHHTYFCFSLKGHSSLFIPFEGYNTAD